LVDSHQLAHRAAIATALTILIVVVIVAIAAVGVRYVALNQSPAPSSAASDTSKSSFTSPSSSPTSPSSSASTIISSVQTTSSLYCPTEAFSNLTSLAGSSNNGVSSLSYNPIDLFGNFSSMSIRLTETANGTSAFSDNSSYVVLGTPEINNTQFVEVNFTASIGMSAFGLSHEVATAWFTPSGNATKFSIGSVTYSGQMATEEASSLVASFEALVSIGNVITNSFPSAAFSSLNQTTVILGDTQMKVTNYALSQSYVNNIESACPSANIGSAKLAWQSGPLGGTNLVTYFDFSISTSATGSFEISEQVISLTKAA